MTRLTVLKLGLLATAFAGAYGVAVYSVDFIEGQKGTQVRQALRDAGLTWAMAEPDGMQIVLHGEAPDEAARFRAITLVSQNTNPLHIRDKISVTPQVELPLLAYEVDILRNGTSVLMHGLVPAGPDAPVDLETRVAALVPGLDVDDILTRSVAPAPKTWDAATELGLKALAALQSVRVSITPGTVEVTGLAPTDFDADTWATALKADAPDGVTVDVSLRQARERLSPFSMRLVNDGNGVTVETCAVERPEDADRISAALAETGGRQDGKCQVALGAPDQAWPEVTAAMISALSDLGRGAITLTDNSVTVLPESSVSEAVKADVRNALPETYKLTLLTPKGLTLGGGGPRLQLTRSADGPVTIQGQLANAMEEIPFDSLADGRFGSSNVTKVITYADDLPERWGPRGLAAINGLAELIEGDVTVTPEAITITGSTANPEGAAAVESTLRDTLGNEEVIITNVTYVAPPDPTDDVDPQACLDAINKALVTHKISFASGAIKPTDDSLPTIDAIAEVLRGDCMEIAFEIGGHTDSSGSEDGNLNMSQLRAEAVLNALAARRVLTSQLSAKGYGETQPIADNSTDAGKEANRRIAFRLTLPH